MSGRQGLREEDKLYTLTKNWLRTEVFQEARAVDIKVKAHSGASLTLHPGDAAGLRRASRDEAQALPPEINVAFPSVSKQIELAMAEYTGEGKRLDSVGLVMLSGGITDIGVSELLSSTADNAMLRSDIVRYCREEMTRVLQQIATAFPAATAAVIGYFPMISPQTPVKKLTSAYLEVQRVPDPLKVLVNNKLFRRFFRADKRKALERSRIWFAESNRNFRLAVDAVNTGARRMNTVFVESPLTEAHALETPNTLLFRMRDGRTNDYQYDERKSVCQSQLDPLEKATGQEFSVRLCEIAAIGHPNVEGTRLYAEAVKRALRPIFAPPTQQTTSVITALTTRSEAALPR